MPSGYKQHTKASRSLQDRRVGRLVFGCQYSPEITKKSLERAGLIHGPTWNQEKASGPAKQGHSIRPKQSSEQTCSAGVAESGPHMEKTRGPRLFILPLDESPDTNSLNDAGLHHPYVQTEDMPLNSSLCPGEGAVD